MIRDGVVSSRKVRVRLDVNIIKISGIASSLRGCFTYYPLTVQNAVLMVPDGSRRRKVYED